MKAGLEDIALPSGARIRARRPSAEMLAGWGLLLEALDSTARQFFTGEELANVEARNRTRLWCELLLHCYADPQLSLEPKEGEIHPRSVPLEDARFILYWALRRPGSELNWADKLTDYDKRLLKSAGIAGEGI